MPQSLERFVLVRPANAGSPRVLATSPHINPTEATQIAAQVPLIPPLQETDSAYALMRVGDGAFIFARAQTQAGQASAEYISIDEATLVALGGHLSHLWTLFDAPIPTAAGALSPLNLKALPKEAHEREWALLSDALAEVDGDMLVLLSMLGYAVAAEGLSISDYPQAAELRARLVQALGLLLPAPYRHQLTFSTYSDRVPPYRPRLIFCDVPQPSARKQMAWLAEREPLPLDGKQAGAGYIAYLMGAWQGDLRAFLALRHSLDALAAIYPRGGTLGADLDQLSRRHLLDRVIAGEVAGLSPQIEDVWAALRGLMPPQGDLYLAYLDRLLRLVLDERRPEMELFLAQQMDAQVEVAAHLSRTLDQALEIQPDAVYAFVRARLMEALDEPWLARLHQAAQRSFSVALRDCDAKTVGNWLELFAREPSGFGLASTFDAGILSARARAYDDPALALRLLVLAYKRAPQALPALLGDEALVAVLPSPVQAALVDLNPRALETLAEDQRELFLYGLHRMIDLPAADVPLAWVRYLWEAYRTGANYTTAEVMRPRQLLLRIAQLPHLEDETLAALLTLPLVDGDEALFRECIRVIQRPRTLLLAKALEQSNRSISDLVALLINLLHDSLLTPQEVADCCADIINDHNWGGEVLPLIDHLSRLINLYPDVNIASSILWHMVEMPHVAKNDALLKNVTRQLLFSFHETITEAQLLRDVGRLRRAVQHNPHVRPLVLQWWRDYGRSLSLGQLSKLERAFEGNAKGLDDLYQATRTMLALRRVLGGRSIADFAADIAAALRLVQVLVASFDDDDHEQSYDTESLHSALEAYDEDLPSDVRHALATNLRDLAQGIVALAERRTKPSLIRSDEQIERQLSSGEANPESALDVLRWLSGYLERAHHPEGAGEAD